MQTRSRNADAFPTRAGLLSVAALAEKLEILATRAVPIPPETRALIHEYVAAGLTHDRERDADIQEWFRRAYMHQSQRGPSLTALYALMLARDDLRGQGVAVRAFSDDQNRPRHDNLIDKQDALERYSRWRKTAGYEVAASEIGLDGFAKALIEMRFVDAAVIYFRMRSASRRRARYIANQLLRQRSNVRGAAD